MKRFVIRPFILVALILLTIALWATAYSYKWHYGLAYRLGLIEIAPAPSLEIGEEKYMAHAAGEIDGFRYTNSLEAVQSAIDSGYRFIEMDMRQTLDGHYFGAHSIDDFNEETGSNRWILPPTVSQIRESKIHELFTPVLLTDMAPILKAHPQLMLDIDKGEDFVKMMKECPYPNQMIIETTTANRYIAARAAGFSYVAYSDLDKDFIEELGVKILVVDNDINPKDPFLNEFCRQGGTLLISGFDHAQDIPADFLKLRALFYVDQK